MKRVTCLIHVSLAHRHELVGGGLRADAEARVISAQEVSDEGALAGGVLARQHDHGPGREVRIREFGTEKVRKAEVLFDGKKFVLLALVS